MTPETSEQYKAWVESIIVAFDCRYYPHNCQAVFYREDAALAFQEIASSYGFSTSCYWGSRAWDTKDYWMVQEWSLGEYRLVQKAGGME